MKATANRRGGVTFDMDDETGDQGEPCRANSSKEQDKAQARAEGVKRFRALSAQQITVQMRQHAEALGQLTLAFRAMDGTMSGDPLPGQLRDMADYLEDL